MKTINQKTNHKIVDIQFQPYTISSSSIRSESVTVRNISISQKEYVTKNTGKKNGK